MLYTFYLFIHHEHWIASSFGGMLNKYLYTSLHVHMLYLFFASTKMHIYYITYGSIICQAILYNLKYLR